MTQKVSNFYLHFNKVINKREKRLTLGELKHQIREIQDYYKLSDNTEIIVRVNEDREYIDIDGEIIKVKE